jgi:hypothetical protein
LFFFFFLEGAFLEDSPLWFASTASGLDFSIFLSPLSFSFYLCFAPFYPSTIFCEPAQDFPVNYRVPCAKAPTVLKIKKLTYITLKKITKLLEKLCCHSAGIF